MASLFASLSFPTTVAPCIFQVLWLKLCVNCCINAITAIHDAPNKHALDLLASSEGAPPGLRESLVSELVAVGNLDLASLGSAFRLSPPLVLEAAGRVAELTAGNVNSTLQDVRSGRVTEIRALNGYVVRRGGELGVDTPANAWLVEKVEALRPSS
ncbi:hypothetical protein TeGR_g12512 [Tetraparma gracilis]|uniref:Ketopantoate reductase C-terminal domain-containing protein n=1 Tax=Tetraparma gracilis TaxID=2962635 RepID=A0ABQ6N0K3_9STRA|nr:hypothetical protein TeGR_g12512 [Tetraparma gracilis]